MAALTPIILASTSPRRRQLLSEAGYDFGVMAPSPASECGICSGESAPELVARLALRKAADVASRIERGIVIGCDTVAECHGRILGKPCDVDDARDMLQHLSGREHRVYSGLCLWPVPEGTRCVRTVTTVLRMDNLAPEALESYLASGDWEGKAGAFGYQDGPDWLHIVEGSASNVVGLPLEALGEMLAKLGRQRE